MTAMDVIAKEARSCQTKSKWENFFEQYGSTISSANTSRSISEVFKSLQKDSQCLQYNPDFFGYLIKGCLSSWNLELGRTICNFTHRLSSPRVAIPTAKLFLESGLPLKARATCQRSLRLRHVGDKDRLQLEMLVCSSFAEDGKHSKAARMLKKLVASTKDRGLDPSDLAILNIEAGRTLFFLGKYHEASAFFRDGSSIHVQLEDWENAAKSLFNTAMCYHNGGEKLNEGFAYVEQSRQIAETYNFPGPLSHVESFYGLDAFHHGNFVDAREHFRRSLSVIPAEDNGYRRLHIISMLTLTYLIQGRYRLARRFGKETLGLAKLDQSDKYQMRYLSLEAEILWENGQIAESQKLLSQAFTTFKSKGIHTLEELSAYSRYLFQSATLESKADILTVEIDKQLRKNSFNWLEFLFAEANIKLVNGRQQNASKNFQVVESEALRTNNRYHAALGLLGQIESYLSIGKITASLQNLTCRFEIAVGHIGDTPLRTNVHFINAAISYRSGNLDHCAASLRAAEKNPRISFANKFAVECWLNTIEGRASRLSEDWQLNILAHMTNIYFAPSLDSVGNGIYRVSRHYEVDLTNFPSLDDMLQYLLQAKDFRAFSEEIQTEVWRQSLKSRGWKQKIRNTNMRLRELFPCTIAPLILHREDISIFSSAIIINADINTHISANADKTQVDPIQNEAEVVKLTTQQKMTSSQLAVQLRVSPSTMKRMLRKMVANERITSLRQGRGVFYSATKKTTSLQ